MNQRLKEICVLIVGEWICSDKSHSISLSSSAKNVWEGNIIVKDENGKMTNSKYHIYSKQNISSGEKEFYLKAGNSLNFQDFLIIEITTNLLIIDAMDEDKEDGEPTIYKRTNSNEQIVHALLKDLD